MTEVTRREMIGAVAGSAIAITALGGCGSEGKVVMPKNEDFYSAEGVFDEKAAKEAYYAMMERFGYPIPERLRGEDFWTLDFGLGQFAETGMAGIFWINRQEDNYMGHEIYLLPNQMIPEHWHVATETAGPKMEAWQLRYGSVTLYSEGEPTPGVDERIPPLHRDIAIARTEQVLKPGEMGYLAKAEARHFMLAGPEGAIVTEYATYHDMEGLRFTHPDIKL